MPRISAKLARTKRIIAAGGLLAVSGAALSSPATADSGDGHGYGLVDPWVQGVDGRKLRSSMMER